MNPAVSFEGVCKSFGAVKACDDLWFSIRRGSIHGIVGENGAGKSTSMQMLYGLISPDSGSIRVGGRAVCFENPCDAVEVGIGMVHQHFMLADNETVLDNVLVSNGAAKPGSPVPRGTERLRVQTIAKGLGFMPSLDAEVSELTLGQKQKLEIIKLVYQASEVLILDEPTAVLTPSETEALGAELKKLKRQGKTIILITHKLREIFDFTDEVTVMRGGRVVKQFETARVSEAELIAAMVGEAMAPPMLKREPPGSEIVWEMKGVKLRGLESLDLTVSAGEILGSAGVTGNGQAELIDACLDPHTIESGEIIFRGRSAKTLSALALRRLGMATVLPDRHEDGLFLDETLSWNFALGHRSSREFYRGPWLKRKAVSDATQKAISAFQIKAQGPRASARSLSGGNQQKLIVARALFGEPDFVLVCEPTRGVDIGAQRLIYQELLARRAAHAGMLLISSDLDEVLLLVDRIHVLSRGRLSEAVLPPFDRQRIGFLMGGSS